ncbi:MAG TPA: hypothetical protein VKE42_09995 [Candidatus Cybelea sp.]|nr:hypothetical protein [Candidatus Cybelea sp.]
MKRHWVPPLGLGFGQLCHGASWLLALWIALRTDVANSPLREIAWVHLVALGWLTTTALSILLHAIPAFLDVRWRSEGTARTALFFFGVAVVAFVVAFLAAPQALFAIGVALGAVLTIYLATAWATLGAAMLSPDRVDRAVARAFAATLMLLFITMLLGVGSASLFGSFAAPQWIAQLPTAHAGIALFGWLTLLIYGVSARTLRPITGNRSQRPMLHVITGSTTLFGALFLAAGNGAMIAWLSWLGGGLIALGAAAYSVDVAAILSGSTVTYRPPQYFIAAGVVWLAAALALGGGVLAGAPWASAFVFLMLAGWAGQMVNGHILHIGVRLIATIYRGEDDETEPRELLDARRPWFAYAAMQIAVALVTAGLISQRGALTAAGAAIGLMGWFALMSALAAARQRAAHA